MRNYNIKPSFITFVIFLSLIFSGIAFAHGKASPKETGIRTLYLIRHGEYNQKDPRSSFVGKGLVPLGIAQARLVAARLRTYPVRFDSLYSSTMTRAIETALVINQDFPYLKLKKSPLISECTPPAWRIKKIDMKRAMTCKRRLDRAFKVFFVPAADGEKNDIVVCHGNVIRYFVTKVLGVDTRAWLNMSIYNCSLTVVRIYPDGHMKLVSYNDIGHIPPSMQTQPGPEEELKLLKVPAFKH